VRRNSCFAVIIGLGTTLDGFTRLIQHKDSKMLCISHEEHPKFVPGLGNVSIFERPGCVETYIQEEVTGEWDGEHDQSTIHVCNCLHCSWYCVRASIAMINNYYGGDLLQDRISYQIFKDWRPEADSDLGHGAGVYPNSVPPTLAWALNNVAELDIPIKINLLTSLTWGILKNEIDAGRPLYITWGEGGLGTHASVINGYEEIINPVNGNIIRVVNIADPWPGAPTRYIFEQFLEKLAWYILLPPVLIEGREQEVTVNLDVDEDGVVGFDEDYRFCSVFFNADTDEDCIPDKKEIRSYTFYDKDLKIRCIFGD